MNENLHSHSPSHSRGVAAIALSVAFFPIWFPCSGRLLAQFLGPVNGKQSWSTNGATPAATTCYDTSTGSAAYSVTYNNGNNVNCALSFRMQAGD